MADTAQLVNWSLEQGCKLRGQTCGQVGERVALSLTMARAYSAGLRERRHGFGVFGDIYVSCYLVALGESPEAAEAIVRETEAEEKRRAEKRRMENELRAMKDEHLNTHIFVGLNKVSPPPSEIEGDDDEEHVVPPSPWFAADDLAEAIRRATKAGISVTYLTHHSASGELDRHRWEGLTDPLAILTQWREEGCSEKFSAGFRVPDKLVQG